MEEILTPVPYQRNGSHVNGGDSNLIVSQEQNEDLNEDWPIGQRLRTQKKNNC